MRTVNVQFHMLLDELIDFVADVSVRYSLSIRLDRWFPDVVRDVPVGADLRADVREFGHVDRISLLYKPPRCRKVVLVQRPLTTGRKEKETPRNKGKNATEGGRQIGRSVDEGRERRLLFENSVTQ